MSDPLTRILCRGRVEIENTIVVTGYSPFEPGKPQTAIQAPAVQVKWWANRGRKQVEHSRVYWRFGPRSRIGLWFYAGIFADTYYETTKPTLTEALADVEANTRPRWRDLEALVAENEVQKERWQEGVTLMELMRCV